jgi:hypothetical protein
MRYVLSGAVSVLLLFAAEVSLLSGATIKRKDGQIVEGVIKNVVVQKGKVKVESSTAGAKTYTVNYVVTNGDRISAIDEQGIHSSSTMLLRAIEEGQPPTDVEVLKPGETGFSNPRKGGKLTVFAIDGAPKVPINEPLLGSIRRKPGTSDEQLVIVPELDIATTDGTVTVRVSNIIAFEQKKE